MNALTMAAVMFGAISGHWLINLIIWIFIWGAILCNNHASETVLRNHGVNIAYDDNWIYGNVGNVTVDGVDIILIDDLDEVR